MKTNTIQKYFSRILAIICLLIMYSCDNKEYKIPSEVIGTWSDTDVQSATESLRYLSLKLYEDGSGDFYFESLVYIRVAGFTWTFKNNIVTCTGTMIETASDGEIDIDPEWVGTFKYTGSSLIPQNSPYKDFILTLYGGDSSDHGSSGDKEEDQETDADFEYAVGINYMTTSGNTHLMPLVWRIPSGMRSKGLSVFGIAIKCLNGKITNKNGHEDGMHTESIGSYKYFHTSVQDNKTDFSVIMYVTSSDTDLEFEFYPLYTLDNKEVEGVKRSTTVAASTNNNDNNDNNNNGNDDEKNDDINGNSYNSLGNAANCYIVSKSGSYKFKTVKGNSSTSVGSASKAEILWESFGTSTKPAVGDLIKSATYKDGYIYFKTADEFKEGNAVIAAKNSSGEILWSWHIWLTDQPQGQVYYNNAGTMMDRNLGATSATPGDVGALGLHYQWGRKDPFLGSSSINNDAEAASTGSWTETDTSEKVGTIEYTIQNPTTFISGIMDPGYDWHYSNRNNELWNEYKTIYDPCPDGWRVPDGDYNGIWSKACGEDWTYYYDFSEQNLGMNFTDEFGNSEIIWYPASGSRVGIGPSYFCDSGMINTGVRGQYWSINTTGNKAHCLYLSYYENHNPDGNVNPRISENRYRGCSVRCVKD